MWWQYIIIVLGLAFLAYAVALIAGVETRFLTRKTDRRAEDLYPNYAHSKKDLSHRGDSHQGGAAPPSDRD